MKRIDLIQDTIDNNDVDNLIKWLSDYPRLTKGPVTIAFEEKFANWIGSDYAVFVNSGSSANLLMVYALKHAGLMRNNKFCVPSLCWATDLAPVLQFDMEPLLIDCNLENLSVDIEHLEKVFIEESPSALILVSVLGLSPDMDAITALCEKYDVVLLEDNCESQGTSYKGKRLGNFGLMSSFSTYFGHTMSTIEGGVITTNDKSMYDLLLQLRSHGWDRDLSKDRQDELRSEWGVDDFSALYSFYVPGFNLRSTDLQAFIGMGQLDKVDNSIQKRYENYLYYKEKLSGKVWFPNEIEDSFTANFAIPVILESEGAKLSLVKELEENNIACRPLISGSMGSQPFYKKIYGEKKLPNCSIVDERGVYVPNHPLLEKSDIDRICEIVLNHMGVTT
jgi:CDP-6-deoxy-D-xylo-4-hexulose-3-dehydrase